MTHFRNTYQMNWYPGLILSKFNLISGSFQHFNFINEQEQRERPEMGYLVGSSPLHIIYDLQYLHIHMCQSLCPKSV